MSPQTRLSPNYPALFKPTDATGPIYLPRIQAFAEAGAKAGMTPAHTDSEKIAVLLIDQQICFCYPDGSLYVEGAQQDLLKLLEWLYANAHRITNIYVSLDTHHIWQIFFTNWWSYEDGSQPAPYTLVTRTPLGDTVDDADRRIRPVVSPSKSLNYVQTLEESGKFKLMLWPQHAGKGEVGNALMPALSEFLAYWATARKAQPVYLTKGEAVSTENYGIFGAEVEDPSDPSTGLNTTVLDAIARNHRVYITGQAKSHCVLTSAQQYVNYFENDKQLLARTGFLMFCTSSVKHDQIDFDKIANDAFAELKKRGVQLINDLFLL